MVRDTTFTRRGFLKGTGTAASASILPIPRPISRQDHPATTTDTWNFRVHAVEPDIVYNTEGLHEREGAMYVLEQNLEAVERASGQLPGSIPETDLIQPLVLRANVGDTVQIEFVNDLDRHASMHIYGTPYDPTNSDGAKVGFNPDSTVAPGESRRYEWTLTEEGSFFFADFANPANLTAPESNHDRANLHGRGLFGALIVEPEGATWTDPKTGGPLPSGPKADIHVPGGVDHREFAVFYHDPHPVDQDGELPIYPMTDIPFAPMALNYRSDPVSFRVGPEFGPSEAFYSSFLHNDPGGGDLVFDTYTGDPVKWIAIGAQSEENHVHHLHNHRWKEIPRRPRSDTIDARTLGPAFSHDTYLTAGHGPGTVRPDMSWRDAFSVGAGYAHGGVGDALFHCHLFPHYGEGMTGIMRMHDKLQSDLAPLPNNDPLLAADSPLPGFLELVDPSLDDADTEVYDDGFPEIPPKPPGLQSPDRPLTEAEEARFGTDFPPGAPLADPVVNEPEAVRDYTIVAMPAEIVYNDAGEYDPNGIVYVLEEDAEAVRSGEMNPEPLIIRANVGDAVNLTIRNEVNDDDPVSIHPHFVAFDPLGSDSTMTGYNYDESVPAGEEGHFRWYADEEGPVFFHDHMNGIEAGMHGIFGCIIVEPSGSTWHDPYTGEEIRAGTVADIHDPNGEDFREFVAMLHDFAPLVDRATGEFVNKAEEHSHNAGTMAINYRNAPFYNRDGADPAYVHSSYQHGDPPTPVFESYDGDPIRLRVIQGAYEEQHSFTTYGLRPQREAIMGPDSTSQVIGTSEAYTFSVYDDSTTDHSNPSGLPVHDHLLASTPVDDFWAGMWGLMRSWGAETPHLQPLPDRGSPTDESPITETQLREMGHPAPYDNRAQIGHKGTLMYDADDDRTLPPDYEARHNEHVGTTPPPAPSPGNPGPSDAEVRSYDLTAIQVPIPYNERGDVDPYGVVFVEDDDVEAVRSGQKDPKPPVIRAHHGEVVEINLTNDLPPDVSNDHVHPQMAVDAPWERSNRISIHPQRVSYDMQTSDGVAAGFNYDQTAAPGETITYRWYADEEHGACVLWDNADLRSTRHHGAYGMLIVEPVDSEWLDPATGEPTETAPTAMIRDPNGEDYREFPLMIADGQAIRNTEFEECAIPFEPEPGQPRPSPEELEHCLTLGDPEDQGRVSINYRSEPFRWRFKENNDQHLVFDSETHGDPATPILRAFTGDPVRLRVAQVGDKADGTSFSLAGHQWKLFSDTEGSPIVGVDERFTPGRSALLDLIGGAGGPLGLSGDYRYGGNKRRIHLEGGKWGIFRVRDNPLEFNKPIQPLPDRAVGVPITARPGWNVVTADITGDGATDVIIGVPESGVAADSAGAVYIFYGPVDPGSIQALADADVQLLGERRNDRAGQGIRLVNGTDGKTYVVVEGASKTYIFAGNRQFPASASLAICRRGGGANTGDGQ